LATQVDIDVTFPRHLEVLKTIYCNPQFALMVLTIFSGWDLDVQQGLFKLTMKFNVAQAMAEVMDFASNKVNPTIVNPLTRLW